MSLKLDPKGKQCIGVFSVCLFIYLKSLEMFIWLGIQDLETGDWRRGWGKEVNCFIC